ncbi:lymphocyte function-associated antigen 3 [Heliangelus exortis]|uniref:lymphocyte function-associated antigen 3 n=1 Tax=Heliangelus exortis TaxID=472823 RepID=UPI003A9082A1
MWLLGCFFIGIYLAQVHCMKVFAIVGEDFTFPVEIDKEMVEITWKKNKNKVAEWDLETKTKYYPSLRNRSLLHTDTGSLTIFNLEESDAGTYVLECLHSKKEFILDVFAPPPEPKISCNISGDYSVLRCAADHPKPLHYAWYLSSSLITAQTQDFILSKKNVVATEIATCFIKVSQTEKSSTISLTQCFPGETEDSPQERDRSGLIAACFLAAVVSISVLGKVCVGVGVWGINSSCQLGYKGTEVFLNIFSIYYICFAAVMNKLGKGRPAQNDGPMHGSGEHHLLHSMDSNKEHPTSDREVTQGAEGGNEEDVSNSPRCSKEAGRCCLALGNLMLSGKTKIIEPPRI